MDILQQLSENLQKGDTGKVAALTQAAIEQKLETQAILDRGLIAGMTVVGEKFKAHEIFLPDVLLAARAMHAGMELLKPLMIREGIPTVGKVVIGTVQGDLHDIGKNLVGIMLKGAGFDVIDLGKDVPPERFVDAAEKEKAAIIGLSALLTTTMPVMKDVVDLARERGIREKIKIIVGGAPLSKDYADQIGADAYCFDGVNAVDCVKRFTGSS
ncbi:MAG: corrinoid protein [candidate division Zixibacteria bacterium]|nr:corrinoid protein [candidate division Zixibacteria bacterium]